MSVELIFSDNTPESESPLERHDIYHHPLACINHLSKEACEGFGREMTQEFVKQFELNSYQNKFYCAHETAQKLISSEW